MSSGGGRGRPYPYGQSHSGPGGGYRLSMGPSNPSGRPPGTTGSASSALPANNHFNQVTEEQLLASPHRKSQPHLHPRKANGALWFGVDPSVNRFVRKTWQGYFFGLWRSWNKVPKERRTTWWHTFVQNYYWEPRFHAAVYFQWKFETRTSICERISRKYRKNKKPKYIGDDDWTLMLEYWATEEAAARSKKAADSRTSDPDGKGMHKHSGGPKSFLKHEYDMMVEGGTDEPPALTQLVRKTHTHKDGTFIDPRAEAIVLEVEQASSEFIEEEGSPNGLSQTASSGPSRHLLNKEYIKRGKRHKGNIYGIGSVQYREKTPLESAESSLARNIDIDERIDGLEGKFKTWNDNVDGVRREMTELKTEIKGEVGDIKSSLNAFLRHLGIPCSAASSTGSQQLVDQHVPRPVVQPTSQPDPPVVASPEVVPASSPPNQNQEFTKWCTNLGL